jgi:DNA-binding NarL/FixJ family response regulator
MALQLRPDVVLMDISMPRADGIEATRQIKRAIPEVSVIGLSMHETEEMVATIRNAGATEYLTKTTPVEDLLSAILRLHPAPNR